MPFTSETGRENGLAHGAKGGKVGGKATSPRKTLAAQTNGRKSQNGGKPRKDDVSDCTCGLDTHPTSCPVGQRLYRRARRAEGKDKNK